MTVHTLNKRNLGGLSGDNMWTFLYSYAILGLLYAIPHVIVEKEHYAKENIPRGLAVIILILLFPYAIFCNWRDDD